MPKERIRNKKLAIGLEIEKENGRNLSIEESLISQLTEAIFK